MEMEMFDGWDIAGNRQVFADLVALLRTGKAVGFVGAGASASSGFSFRNPWFSSASASPTSGSNRSPTGP